MKGSFKRILNSLNLNGRDWAVLLLALLLAFSIWMIHNMALKYNDTLQVSVVAVSNIDGHAQKSLNACQVTARCRATGYKLLISDLKNKGRNLEVNFPATAFRHKSGDEFYILSSDLIEYSQQIFESGVAVEYFSADTLFYRFPLENHKVVPVVPVLSVSYRSQYMSDGDFHIEPDSVVVYGEPFRLDGLTEVQTQPIRLSDLHSDVSGTMKLEEIRGIRYSTDEINYSVDVVRYAQTQVVASIRTINVPADTILSIYPSVAQVSLKYEFPPVVGFNEDVNLVVDYADFKQSLSGKCAVRLSGSKTGIIQCDIDPPYVECVVEKK